jgi:outer membrane protease
MGYSIRHAVITALFKFMKETEVNAFTGHSNNPHTSLNYYYHLDKNWAGKVLADMKTQSVSMAQITQEVQELIW